MLAPYILRRITGRSIFRPDAPVELVDEKTIKQYLREQYWVNEFGFIKKIKY